MGNVAKVSIDVPDPIKYLATAVVHRAYLDSIGKVKRSEFLSKKRRQTLMDEAKEWFKTEDALVYCSVAETMELYKGE